MLLKGFEEFVREIYRKTQGKIRKLIVDYIPFNIMIVNKGSG